MSSKQFAVRFVIGVFGLLALIGVFNRIVDPFWYYRDIEIKGFNAVKTKFERYERYVKPALLMRDRPEAIILGNSFSEIGFDPTNPSFTDHGRLKGMNFALAGASWDMVQCEFEFAVNHAPIKRVLIGFIPGNLPIADCKKDFGTIGQVSTVQLLFSDRALQASIDTIRDQKDKMPSHTREGMYFMSHYKAGTDNRFREMFNQKANQYKQNGTGLKCLQELGSSGTESTSSPMKPLDLAGLRHVIRIAREHGIELVLFAYPSHAYMQELVEQCESQSESWQALKQISRLIEAEAAKDGQVRAYQFYGYNDITAESIGEAPAHYWQDPRHFSFEMGELMLADMFGGNAMNGHRLVAANIDRDYLDFSHTRVKYLQSHPEFQSNMNKLLPLQ